MQGKDRFFIVLQADTSSQQGKGGEVGNLWISKVFCFSSTPADYGSLPAPSDATLASDPTVTDSAQALASYDSFPAPDVGIPASHLIMMRCCFEVDRVEYSLKKTEPQTFFQLFFIYTRSLIILEGVPI